MEFRKTYYRQLIGIFAISLAGLVGLGMLLWSLFTNAFGEDLTSLYACWGISMSVAIFLLSTLLIRLSFKPLGTLADVVVHAGHGARNEAAPQPDKLRIGRGMITTLASQVYDMASMTEHSKTLAPDPLDQADVPIGSDKVLDLIGTPLIALDSAQNVTAFNKAAQIFTGLDPKEVLGKPLYDTMRLTFRIEETLERWIKDRQQNAINDDRQWERVRLVDGANQTLKQFDLVAHFAKANGTKHETTIALFDRTDIYSRDDQETSFVALAVHELRTPLTVMRGYIEVFEDEVGPTLSPELTSFMHKMQASAQQLTAFVSNILNVARVEENQLILKLQQYSWQDIVKNAVDDLSLRAAVHGIHIETHIDPNIPTVAVDRLSIHEVINNLVDNAIKYSDKSDKIIISSVMNSDGLVETSVQDFGIGIPTAVMPDLFQKYHRSHKSRVQITGTGLGLFLCRAIVSAHGGNIWVRSKEGEGSVFSFTIQPFDSVKHEQATNEDGIMRGAHGWIKNHSLNRQ